MSHVWNTPICVIKFFINTLLPKITHLPIIQHIRIKWAIILIRSWYRSNDIVLLDQLPLMKSNWSLGETDKEPRNPFRCRSQLAISMLYRWPKSFGNYFKESAILKRNAIMGVVRSNFKDDVRRKVRDFTCGVGSASHVITYDSFERCFDEKS